MQDAAQIRKKDRRDGKTKQQKAAIMEERGMAPAVRCLYALGCQSGKMHSVAQNRRAKSIGGSEEAKKSTLVTYDVFFVSGVKQDKQVGTTIQQRLENSKN